MVEWYQPGRALGTSTVLAVYEAVSRPAICYIPFMDIEVISSGVTLEHLRKLADTGFGDLVKAVVDVELGIMAIGGELHADEEAILLEGGSRQQSLWGINIYADLEGDDRIEFDSMINIRPAQGNRSRGVDDPAIRATIVQIVDQLVAP